MAAGGPASDGEQAGKVSDSEQAEAGAASGSPRAVQELAARSSGPQRWPALVSGGEEEADLDTDRQKFS